MKFVHFKKGKITYAPDRDFWEKSTKPTHSLLLIRMFIMFFFLPLLIYNQQCLLFLELGLVLYI